MRILVPALLLLILFEGCGSGDTSTITFRVTVPPALTENGVFITGNDPSMGDWDPGRIKLERISDSVWAKSFTFLKGQELEFKFTGGNWLLEAADSTGRIRDNLTHRVSGDSTLQFSIPAWFNNYASDTLVITGKRVSKEAPGLDLHGGWLALAGFGLLIFFVVYQILLDYAVIVTPFFGTTQVYVYGLLGLVISMSLYLSYNFAFLNKDLKKQLQTVKELSDKTLEQERIAASLEMERRLVEAENERRKAELEAARDLQLSLLPAKLPDIPGLGLASHIETATEVGGDYYDFFRGEDGSLMIAVGDATGHGLKAGNMVIATKALLNSLSGSTVLPEILMSANGSIKKMNLKMLTMCLALVRIRGDVLEYASAGMPHLLIRRGDTGIVEQHILKAMPLGAFTGFPYAGSEIPFRKGDTLVVMSDGLTELFNSNGETAGIDRVAKWLASAPASSAGDVLASIRSHAGTWRGDEPLRDDLTILVVQKKD